MDNEALTGTGSATLVIDSYRGAEDGGPTVYETKGKARTEATTVSESRIQTGPETIAVTGNYNAFWHVTAKEHAILRASLRASATLIAKGRVKR